MSAEAAKVEIRDPGFTSVVGKDVAVEKLATGFIFTEGPLWHARERYLLFSDMPGDHLRKWSARDGVSTAPRATNRTSSSCGAFRPHPVQAGRRIELDHHRAARNSLAPRPARQPRRRRPPELRAGRR